MTRVWGGKRAPIAELPPLLANTSLDSSQNTILDV
jgi:hypothetical protein